MYDPKHAVFVAGIAKPGKEDSISSVYQNLSLGLVVDCTTDQILDLGCSMVMEETVYFVRQLLVGKNLVRDMKEMVELLRTFTESADRSPLRCAESLSHGYGSVERDQG